MAFEGELLALLPRLRRFAAGLSRNAADGDDLCQAALERALKSRHLWAEGTRLDSWMYRIMRNIWIDEARARQRRAKTFAPEEEGENAPDPGDRRIEARSEEHTSELQSLMRISYAVFCLNKKTSKKEIEPNEWNAHITR